jgi:type IV pilus assembly protein PilO
MAIELSLSKLPWYAQIGAFCVLAFAGVGVFYYYYEMPTREDIDSRQTQLNGLHADIRKGMTTAGKLPEFRAQVTELETRLESLRAVLPEEKDVAELLRQLQTVAVQSNITIKSVKPEATVTKQLHAEWPITLQLDGTYHNLALFFDRVGKFTRIVNISALEIKGKDKPAANSTITAQCTATTFVLLDKPGAAAKPGAKPGAPGAKT